MSTLDLYRDALNLDALEAQHALPAGLLSAVMGAESRGDRNAQNPESGAAGLFQFMPDTARAYRIDPYDPQQAAPAAAKMLKSLYVKYDGDLDKTLAGYQWGQGRVDRLGLDHAPKATQSYIATVKQSLTPATADAATPADPVQDYLRLEQKQAAPVDLMQEYQRLEHKQAAPASSDALPTVRPNPDPSQPATLEYPGSSPATRATDPEAPPSHFTLNIEKASAPGPTLTPAMRDDEILRTLGIDPALVMQSRYYQPGMFGKQLVTPGSPGETLTRSWVGDVMHGVRQPLDAGAQLLTRGLEKIGLTSPADVALTDAIIKLKEHEYQQTSRPTAVDLPLVGQTNVGSLAGTMMVPIPGTKGVLPPGGGTLATLGKGVVNGTVAGTVAGVAQPVREPGTPGTANDTYWQQKQEQGQTGALVGGGTGLLTSTAGAVGNKAVNAARNLSPRYAQVEEALTAATGTDGTVNERIFNAALNSSPGAKFAGQEKWEVDGLQKLMQHIQSTSDTLTKAGQWLQTGAIILPGTLTRAGFTAVKLAKMLYSTPQGRNFLLAASDLQPGSGAMSRLVERIGSELPRLMATDTTQPDAPAPAP
jgi:Transglycosylase SLT domain